MAKELSIADKKALVQEATRRLDHDAFFARLEELGIKASDEEPGAMAPIDVDALSLARDCYHKSNKHSLLHQSTRDWEAYNQ